MKHKPASALKRKGRTTIEHKAELVPQGGRQMGKSLRNQAIIQAATAAGKLVVVVHNGAPHFATWDEKAGAIHYEPCPRRHPQITFTSFDELKGKP